MIESIKQYFHSLLYLGVLKEDSEVLRLKKSSLTMILLITAPASMIWALIYILLDNYLSASIPLVYMFLTLVNLWYFKKSKKIILVQKILMSLILLFPFFLMWTLGGFALGGFVMIWSFFAPIAALIYDKDSRSLYWFYAFLMLVLFSTLIDTWLAAEVKHSMPAIASQLFFFLNLTAGLSGIYFLIKFFINEKEKSANERLRKEHETLLKSTEDLKQANLKLSYIAHHDALTHLPNRYYLREQFGKMISLAKRQKQILALLFLDLDNFKEVNDQFGHLMGDEVLQAVSQRITSLLREEDLVARLGGDEFAIAIGGVSEIDYVKTVAKRLIEEISKPYECLNHTSPIGVSIGISLYPLHSEDIETLVNYADKAMYNVKKRSKNDFMIYSVS